MDTAYVCINCGTPTKSLYKEYSSGVLKLCSCNMCQQPVDPYIETDISIVLVDTALQRLKAYRHLLQNDPPNRKWKFSIICLLCDAYVKWVSQRMDHPQASSYFQLEWSFYMSCFLALIDNIIFIMCIFGFLLFWSKTRLRCGWTLGNLLTVSGCAKLFTVPAVLWGWNEGHINHMLINLFVMVSIVQACRASSTISKGKAVATVALSYALKKSFEICCMSSI